MGRTGKLLAVLAPICTVPLNVAAVHASTDNEAEQLAPAPLDPSHCSDGTYVEEPISYAGLVVDCILLVTIRNHFMSDPANSEIDWTDPWKGTSRSNGRVSSLNLGYNQLYGSIPAELGNLTGLEWLSLSRNQLSGPIPAELSNLTNLKVLGLEGNQLLGSIPSQLSALTNLLELRLDDNQFSGPIPLAISNLTNLEWLGLPRNQLSGSIPLELGNLTNLKVLGLDDNQLTGPIPPQLK